MINERNLISTLEQSLRQFQTAELRLQKHLHEVEAKKSEIEEEIKCLHAEIHSLHNSAEKTENALKSLIDSTPGDRKQI